MASTAYYETLKQQDIDIGVGTTTKRNPGGGTLAANKVNIGSFGVGQVATTTTWDPGSITSGSFESKNVTVSGAALGDFVLASFSLDVVDLAVSAQVTAANTVTVTLYNLTGSAVNLSSGTLKVLVLKSA